MEEGVFIDSFDDLALRINLLFPQITPITKTCLFYFNGTLLYLNICGFHTFYISVCIFMSLYASSYIVYDITATTFSGSCVFCKVKRVELILLRYN